MLRHRIPGRLLVALLVAAIGGLVAAPPRAIAADPVLVGAGDIADCATTTDTATAALLDGITGTVVTFGDSVYQSGTPAEFQDCYDPTWGRHKARTRPSAGNHDYKTSRASGYFGYFGSRAGKPGQGWYSYDAGSWHVVVLNSNCGAVGGCGPGSAQLTWLKQDLAARSAATNVLAYWHHPRYSSGQHGPTIGVQPFWDVLYAAGADVVLNGHDHDYERFAPQDPWGRPDDRFGVRQFVVGTGGTALRTRASTAPNSQAFSATHGVLKLTLHATSYDWAFVPIAGSTYTDEGSSATHGKPPPRRSTTFAATSDAHVDQARPSTNFGTATTLWTDGDTGSGLDRHTYLRVTVRGMTGVVDRAVLRLWVTNGTRDGPRIYTTSTSWSGRTLTWRNRPAPIGSALADVGRVVSGSWLEVDVTAAVRGDGTYAFLLRPTSGDGLGLSSMQGAHDPRLLVQTIPGP